jgi:peptidoglycan/xylan/chitin deacetylase (PgdA/CDA1 family)
MIYFTSSWDDGALQDMKLAYLLDSFDQEATFYIPLANVEKREVIGEHDIRMLSKRFEIGAHTMNHRYLNSLSDSDAHYEVNVCKKALEDITQKEIFGFCFPGGKYGQRETDLVKAAGYKYARTINQFRYCNGSKLMNTTLQAYDHSRLTYVKHLLKRSYFKELFVHFPLIMKTSGWQKLLLEMVRRESEITTKEPSIIHLWGHSWELEERDMWTVLKDFLQEIKTLGIPSINNHQAMMTGGLKAW